MMQAPTRRELFIQRLLASLVTASCLLGSPVLAQDSFDDPFGDDEFSSDEFSSDEFGGDESTDSSGTASTTNGAVTNEATPEPGPASVSTTGADPATGTDQSSEAASEGAAVSDDAETAAESPAASAETLREQAFRYANTIYGPTGGVRVVDAAPAYPSTFRVQLATEFFFADGFLNDGDSNDRLGGVLSLSYGVHEFVEVFASVAAYGNFNNTEDPELFQVLGDTVLGAKAGVEVLPWLTLGGDLSLALLNTVGDIGVVLSGTSVGVRGNLSADFRRFDTGSPGGIPLIARLNLQYYFDNSANLVEDVEAARYNALPPSDRRPVADETRNLITRVERFALNINRTDFFNIGIGVEAPIEVADDFFVHPILEWTWGIPVNRQAYDCLFVPDPAGGSDPAPGEDGCLRRQGIGSFPMRLTAAVRVHPPVRGLSAFAGADIGLTGTSTFVRELAATAPYNLMLGLSYAYDTDPEPPAPVIQRVERRVEILSTLGGRVLGMVVEEGTGIPVQDAVVSFDDPELTRLVTSENGSFTTGPFPPGEVGMWIEHERFDRTRCLVSIPENQEDVQHSCPLPVSPRSGSISGHVMTVDGEALAATLMLSGEETRTLETGSDGAFEISGLAAGSYTLQAEAEGYLLHVQSVEVERQAITDLRFELVSKPRRPMVRLRPRAIQLLRQVVFANNRDDILPQSFPLLAEVADLLIRHPEVRRVEIQGHTDDRGGRQVNQRLSEQRANAVREWLVHHGVDAARLEAKGYGASRPLVPNITPGNRARNRRVQFVILER